MVLSGARHWGFGYHLRGCHFSPLFTTLGACFGCTNEVGMASWGACPTLSTGGAISQLYAQRKAIKSEKRYDDMRFSRKGIKRTNKQQSSNGQQTHCTKADYISARHSLLVRIFYDIPDLWRPSTQSKRSQLELSSCQDGYGQHKARTI